MAASILYIVYTCHVHRQGHTHKLQLHNVGPQVTDLLADTYRMHFNFHRVYISQISYIRVLCVFKSVEAGYGSV